MADHPDDNKRYYFYRDQLVLLGAGFAVSSVIIFVLGIMTGRHLERTATTRPSSSAVKIPLAPVPPEPITEQSDEKKAGDQMPGQNRAGQSDTEATKETKAKEKAGASESSKPARARKTAASEPEAPAAKPAVEKPAAAARREQRQKTQTATSDRVWAVQIKSSPDKKFADTWANRLKAKGYDAFVVEGDVKGQTWYRVRVGRFAARREAEELRAALESKEGLSGGFLTKTNGVDQAAGDQKAELGDQKSELGTSKEQGAGTQ